MPPPTAPITGANKGFGLAIARQPGERGFSVWIGARDDARGGGRGGRPPPLVKRTIDHRLPGDPT